MESGCPETRYRSNSGTWRIAIRYHRDIISLRNILIHGYDTIGDRVVWGVIREDLDRLIDDTRNILGS